MVVDYSLHAKVFCFAWLLTAESASCLQALIFMLRKPVELAYMGSCLLPDRGSTVGSNILLKVCRPNGIGDDQTSIAIAA